MYVSSLENNVSVFMDEGVIHQESQIWEVLCLLLWLNSHIEILDKVPNHTLIGENEEEFTRLEERIKFIEELIQEIND